MQAETERASGLVRYPEDWGDTTLESVAEINPETLGKQTPAGFQFRYIDIASVTFGVIEWSSVKTHHFATAPSRARRVVRPGDVLLSTVRPGLQAHTYADWNQQDGYVCSTGFAVLRGGRAIWPRFLYHLVFSDIIMSQVRCLEVGSNYPAISESDVRWLRVPKPPLPEQRRIAETLDTADRTIGETEALISKLKQIKIGLMHDLLTRGLDERGQLRNPDAPPEQFKDSPLGQIPRAWEVRPLGHLIVSAVDGPFGSNLKTEHYVDHHGVRVVRLQNIASGYFNDADKVWVSEEHAHTLRRHEVVPGDLLVASLGDDNHPIARACTYPDSFQPGIVKADCFRLRLINSLAVHRYVMYVLDCSSTRGDINLLGQGVTRDRVNLSTVRQFRLRMPEVPEQRRIVQILDAHDARIRAEEAYRDKLKLQKEGLMEDLLTGRVRVKTAKGGGA